MYAETQTDDAAPVSGKAYGSAQMKVTIVDDHPIIQRVMGTLVQEVFDQVRIPVHAGH